MPAGCGQFSYAKPCARLSLTSVFFYASWSKKAVHDALVMISTCFSVLRQDFADGRCRVVETHDSDRPELFSAAIVSPAQAQPVMWMDTRRCSLIFSQSGGVRVSKLSPFKPITARGRCTLACYTNYSRVYITTKCKPNGDERRQPRRQRRRWIDVFFRFFAMS